MWVADWAPGVLTVGVIRCSSPRVTLWYMLLTSLRTSSYSDTVICMGWARLSPSCCPICGGATALGKKGY